MTAGDTVYLSSFYLAPVEYYARAIAAGKVFIEHHDHYTKQTYRNRCRIAGPEGVLTLSVPIVHPDSPKCLVKDIRISGHGNWRHLHWNALESAYNNTPFFEYYKDDFKPFYEKKYAFLTDFNDELFRLVCQLMDISPVVEYTTAYKTEFGKDEKDFRDSIHPKRAPAGFGFAPTPYYQVFEGRHGFLPNLSAVDLLFNMGPESVLYLPPLKTDTR